MSAWSSWRAAWLRSRDEAAVRRRPIPDLLWRRTLKRFAFLPRGNADELALRRLCSLFLDRKEFSGAHGLVVTDDMAVAIAAQACLPVLRLGLQAYDGFLGIVVHPCQARVRREVADEDGVVHEFDEVLSGEAVEGGPVMLSWRDVRGSGASAAEGYNVVIHEFAHVLDMSDGLTDGVPPLPPALDRSTWVATLQQAHERLEQAIDADLPSVLDPYAAQGPQELFAVASEAFFVCAADLQREQAGLYAMLAAYYQQDPASRA